MEIERNVMELGSDLQASDPQARVALSRADAGWLRSRQSCALSMRAPSISSTIFSSAPGAMSTTPDGLAVPQHGRAMAERGNLEQPVRDEDDGSPGLALPPHDVDDPIGEIRRQRGGHLVEQEHIGLDRQRAGEIEHAQDRQRNAPCGLAEVEVGDAQLPDPAHEG